MSYLNLLKINKAFGLYWIGSTISLLGNSLFSVALPWIVYKITGSAIALSVSIILQMLPYILFGIVSGAYIDRFNQKKLMIISNFCRTVIFMLICLLYIIGNASLAYIYISIFLLSFFGMIFSICEQGIVQKNVDSNELAVANSLMSVTKHTIDFFGKLLSGIILMISIPITLIVISSCLVLSVIIISFARLEGEVSGKSGGKRENSLSSDLKEGFKVIIDNQRLKANVFYLFTLNIAVAPLSVSLPFIAGETQFEAFGLGLMVAFLSLGSLVGAYISVPISNRFKESVIIPLCVILYAAFVPLVSTSLNMYFILSVFFFVGLVSDVGVVIINTEFQKIVPKQAIGRVSALRTTTLRIAVPLVLVVSSLLFSQIGIFKTMVLFSIISILSTLLILLFEIHINKNKSRLVS